MTDYRSDTFTKPSQPMLEAMFRATVGDDVFGEDPTVNKLEAVTSEIFGMEAGLVLPQRYYDQPNCNKMSYQSRG